MEQDFKNIVGLAEEGKPAIIRFFGPVTDQTTSWFNSEFLWLQDYVKPSSIEIQINSEGGSVLYGMNTYSIIQNCPIPTVCVNEGLAASMGSIIWAAGDVSKMRDYAILMIHNPFKISEEESEDACGKNDKMEASPVTEAFRKQIETIYMKRWGLSEKTVKKIMDGGEGEDGTFFDAKGAVLAGIIPSENIIKTKRQAAKMVKAAIEGKNAPVDFRVALDSVIAELSINKLDSEKESNIKAKEVVDVTIEPEENKDTIKNERMEDKLELSLISAALGLQGSITSSEIMAKLPTLVQEAKRSTELQATVNSLNIELTGSKQALQNVEASLAEVKSQLDAYKQAEQEAKEKKINEVVDAAVEAGKIKAESKETWVTMAKNDINLVINTLESIPVAEKISASIENDPALVEDKSKTAAKEVEATIAKAVGEGFKFKKL